MIAKRREIDLSISDEEMARLTAIARSRTEAASRVERARMLLSYREDPSFFAVARALGLHHQTVQRCIERAASLGGMAALDDRPRPGREAKITAEAKAWLVSLACQKPKELGYPHELWTTRMLSRHAREHGPSDGHDCLARLAQGTVCKILDRQEVKPHKVRYYLERRDPEFEDKMREVLCVYREVKLLKKAAAVQQPASEAVAIVSYDEKPGIQAIATTAPDLPPEPGRYATIAREGEYKRHGTVSLLAGIDLLTGTSTATTEPGEGPFHHPAARQDGEALGLVGTLDDFHGPLAELRQSPLQLVARISAIGEDMPEPGPAVADRFQEAGRPITVLNVRAMHHQADHQPQRVDNDVALAPRDLLAGVIARNPAAFRGFHALTVDHASRRRGLPTFQLARLHHKTMVDPAP